jgi:hypothetical protein
VAAAATPQTHPQAEPDQAPHTAAAAAAAAAAAEAGHGTQGHGAGPHSPAATPNLAQGIAKDIAQGLAQGKAQAVAHSPAPAARPPAVTTELYALVSAATPLRSVAELDLADVRHAVEAQSTETALHAELVPLQGRWQAAWWPFVSVQQAEQARAALGARARHWQVVEF